jgi:iron-sulfur cluster assembly accessory protein
MIHLTANAIREVKHLLERQEYNGKALRLGVEGGGCAGLNYKMDFDAPKAGDNTYDYEGVKVLVDPKSNLYLNGMTLDFVETLPDRGFKFINPNAKSSCGCGTSFHV